MVEIIKEIKMPSEIDNFEIEDEDLNIDQENENSSEVENRETIDKNENDSQNVENVDDNSENADEEKPGDEIVIDVEETSEKTPNWVTNLRKKTRELEKENKQLRAAMDSQNTPAVFDKKKPELSDFDFDSEQYEEAYSNWINEKRNYEAEIEEQSRRKKEESDKVQQNWENKLANYRKSAKSFSENNNIADYGEAEETVSGILTEQQAAIIVQGSSKPETVIYGLYRNKKLLEEMAAISDPIDFSFAISKVEDKIRMKGRKPKSEPEKRVNDSGQSRDLAGDRNLEKLRADAEKTGDYSKVRAYKQKIRDRNR